MSKLDKNRYINFYHDDDILDILNRMDKLLAPHNLKTEMADDDFDGYQPVRVVKIK